MAADAMAATLPRAARVARVPAYGACQECDVFTELLCLTPCSTYETFTKPKNNNIMRNCAGRLGLDWAEL